MKYLLLYFLFSTHTFSNNLDEFIKIIENKNIKSVTNLLNILPYQFKNKHLFIYNSLSTQEANIHEPRVLLFSESSDFLFTFNSRPELIGGNKADFIFFNSKESRFDGLSIDFHSPYKPRIQINPPSCFQCHQTFQGSIIPISKTYLGGIFPGIYGSLEDKFTSKEKQLFHEFKSNTHKNKRYRSLRPYQGSKDWAFPNKPSTMLGHLINRNIFQVLSRYFKESSLYDDYKYQILASVTCGEDFIVSDFFQNSSFLPYSFFLEQYEYSNFLKEKKFSVSIRNRDRLMDQTPSYYIQKFSPQYEKSSTWLKSLVLKVEPQNSELLNLINSLITNGTDQLGYFYNFSEFLYPWILKGDQSILADFNWAYSQKTIKYQEFPRLFDLEKTCKKLKDVSKNKTY